MDYKIFHNTKPPGLDAHPDPSNMFVWHFVLIGPSDSPYAGGVYYGKIEFPPSYPMAPPSFKMLTPSGRFQPGAAICMSNTSFHSSEWNPLWNLTSLLVGFQSFFLSNEVGTGAVMNPPSDDAKRGIAAASHAFNAKIPTFVKLFPAFASAEAAARFAPDVIAKARAAGQEPSQDALPVPASVTAARASRVKSAPMSPGMTALLQTLGLLLVVLAVHAVYRRVFV